MLKGIDLRKKFPHLFYDSRFQINTKFNHKIIQKYLLDKELMREEFATDKWLQFTNRQLLLLFQYSIMDDKGFHKVIKLLSLRMKIDSEQILDFWRSVSSELNKDLSEDEYSDKLIKGKITDEIAEAIFTKKASE